MSVNIDVFFSERNRPGAIPSIPSVPSSEVPPVLNPPGSNPFTLPGAGLSFDGDGKIQFSKVESDGVFYVDLNEFPSTNPANNNFALFTNWDNYWNSTNPLYTGIDLFEGYLSLITLNDVYSSILNINSSSSASSLLVRSAESGSNFVELNGNTSPGLSTINVLKQIAGLVQSLGFNTSNDIVLTDQINSKGLVYAADYSANGTMDPRWIPDWGAVTGAISGASHAPVTLGTANGLSLVGQELSLGLASASTTGALSSTDWNTFNGKIGGSINLNQIAFGISGNSINGSNNLTYESNFLIHNTDSDTRYIQRISGNTIGFIRSTIDYYSVNSATSLPLQFWTDGGFKWEILSNGTLRSNGSRIITTTTGNLNINTGGGNGNVVVTPNGTGLLDVLSSTILRNNIVVGSSIGGAVSVYVSKNIQGGNSAFSFYSDSIIQSDVTGVASYFRSLARTVSSSFTLPVLSHFSANQSTFGIGSTITNQYGFEVANTLTGAVNNFGFFGNLSLGTGRWNLYMAGSANNYLAGNLWIGTTSGTNTLDVNGTTRIRTINNLGTAATSVLVPSATGVVSLRTLAELASDMGAVLTSGNQTISGIKTFQEIVLPTLSNNSNLKVGSLEFQSFDVNNSWFGDNLFFNGTSFQRRANGFGSLFYFAPSGEGQFRLYNTGSAGSTITGFSVQLKIDYLGVTVAGGTSISNAAGNYTGATFRADSNGVTIGLNGGAPTARLDVRGAGTTNGLLMILEDSAGTNNVEFVDNGQIRFLRLPTSSAGLPAGSLWNNGGVLNIV